MVGPSHKLARDLAEGDWIMSDELTGQRRDVRMQVLEIVWERDPNGILWLTVKLLNALARRILKKRFREYSTVRVATGPPDIAE